jgi:hypothetical protein
MTSNTINLQNVNSNDFKMILLYCERHHYTNPPEIIRPLQHNDLKKCVYDPWDAEFMNSMDFDGVTELLLAANALEATALVDLCYARLAMYFRGINICSFSYPY